MGWVNDLHGRIVALDTSPLIYYFEDHDPYAGYEKVSGTVS